MLNMEINRKTILSIGIKENSGFFVGEGKFHPVFFQHFTASRACGYCSVRSVLQGESTMLHTNDTS